jgi:ABC-type nitrate/sulfonate/bicarbonate transport system permease component
MLKPAAVAALSAVASPAFAGTNGLIFLSAIPTLDEVGLGLLIAMVAGVAGWAAGRRSRR